MIVHDVDQRTPEWYALRAGMPTASEFCNLLAPKTLKPSASAKTYAAQLANEKFMGDVSPDGFSGNYWTERGEMMEEHAISWYEFSFDVTVTRVGFVTDDGATIGCSPDGLIGDNGALEIKCLKSTNHTGALLSLASGDFPPDFKAQTQGILMICEREWIDLLLFHNKLPPVVVRDYVDEEYVNILKPEIPKLIESRDKMLAELRRFSQSPVLDFRKESE